MRASLPMYDLPEVRHATDAWWRAVAAELRRRGVRGVPRRLARDRRARALWSDPELLLSQTCGHPLARDGGRHLQPILTPVYATPWSDGPRYCSLLIVAADESCTDLSALRGAALAVNGRDSWSGYHVLLRAVARLTSDASFFASMRITGSHRESIASVARRESRLCAVDCVTYALLERHAVRALAGTRVLGRTDAAPGLPWVTRADAPDALVATLRDALEHALHDPGLAAVRDTLLLAGAEPLEMAAYLGMKGEDAQAVAVPTHARTR